jgi:hypothetical protein
MYGVAQFTIPTLVKDCADNHGSTCGLGSHGICGIGAPLAIGDYSTLEDRTIMHLERGG